MIRLLLIAGLVLAPLPLAAQTLRLLMAEKRGCVYCLAWDRSVGRDYTASDAGRAAPLMRVDINGPWPDGLVLARRPFVTPTFILLKDGAEIGRLEGYMSADRFHSGLAALLDQAR